MPRALNFVLLLIMLFRFPLLVSVHALESLPPSLPSLPLFPPYLPTYLPTYRHPSLRPPAVTFSIPPSH